MNTKSGYVIPIALALTLIGSVAYFYESQASQDKDNLKDLSALENRLGNDESKMAVLQNDIDYISRDVTEIKNDIKSIMKSFKISSGMELNNSNGN